MRLVDAAAAIVRRLNNLYARNAFASKYARFAFRGFQARRRKSANRSESTVAFSVHEADLFAVGYSTQCGSKLNWRSVWEGDEADQW